MNKKNIIICLSALLLLVLVTGVAISFLYSGKPGKSETVGAEHFPLVAAVPSDAAMIMKADRFRDMLSVLTDTSTVVRTFFSEQKEFRKFLVKTENEIGGLGSLKSAESLVSMHYSGDLEPLLILNIGSADTTGNIRNVLSFADSASLHTAIVDCLEISGENSPLRKKSLLLFSTSETLIKSSLRHIESGASIMDKPSFDKAFTIAKNSDAIFVSHDYSSKILSPEFNRPYSSFSSFMEKFADWTVLKINNIGEGEVSLSGSTVSSDDPGYFRHIFGNVRSSEMRITDILPANVLFAISVTFDDFNAYSEQFDKFSDATGNLDKLKRLRTQVADSLKFSPEKSLSGSGIKEVGKAAFLIDGNIKNAVLLRVGKNFASRIIADSGGPEKYKGEILSYKYGKLISSIFGRNFDIPENSWFIQKGDWLIIGEKATLSLFSGNDKSNLAKILSDNDLDWMIPGRDLNFLAYFSGADALPVSETIFKEPFRTDFLQSLRGISYNPVLLTIKSFDLNLASARLTFAKTAESEVRKDTVVTVPTGPFKVQNSGTNKVSYFNQSSNLSLSLRDENGKGLWSVPFSSPICGAVATIDYFANGKLQYLFASGNKIYLIDRLGRYVKPFPETLGKEILIGPAAYDFSGAKGYTVVVLHKDNTIGMYDIHGRAVPKWKGIAPKETIKSLPELLEYNGKKYWVVRTSLCASIYELYGGEPLTRTEGNKMIRPDSKIEINGKNISATCYDGKVRNIRL